MHEPPSKVISSSPSLGGLANVKVICVDDVPAVDVGMIAFRDRNRSIMANPSITTTTASRSTSVVTASVRPGVSEPTPTPRTTPARTTSSNANFVIRSRTSATLLNPSVAAARAIVIARRRRNENLASVVSTAIAKRLLNLKSQLDTNSNTYVPNRKRCRAVAFSGSG